MNAATDEKSSGDSTSSPFSKLHVHRHHPLDHHDNRCDDDDAAGMLRLMLIHLVLFHLLLLVLLLLAIIIVVVIIISISISISISITIIIMIILASSSPIEIHTMKSTRARALVLGCGLPTHFGRDRDPMAFLGI